MLWASLRYFSAIAPAATRPGSVMGKEYRWFLARSYGHRHYLPSRRISASRSNLRGLVGDRGPFPSSREAAGRDSGRACQLGFQGWCRILCQTVFALDLFHRAVSTSLGRYWSGKSRLTRSAPRELDLDVCFCELHSCISLSLSDTTRWTILDDASYTLAV
jgi:hypothetical protein